MLNIELRRLPPEVCPRCLDSGIALPRRRKLLTEMGVFCECPAGLEKWYAVKRTISELETALAALPAIPPPVVRQPYGHPSRRFSAG